MSIALRDVTKTYDAPGGGRVGVLDVATWDAAAGEHLALVGGSGSGKTTLLHLVAGIATPDAGSVRVAGTDLATLSEARRDAFRGRHVGYVFQTHHLLPGLTARENVLLGMTFSGTTPDARRGDALLDAVGLKNRRDYTPARLSVGQRQRVAVARALANAPAVLLADEPTGSLDPASAADVIDLLRGLASGCGATLVVVTHDPAVAGRLPRVVRLADINRATPQGEV